MLNIPPIKITLNCVPFACSVCLRLGGSEWFSRGNDTLLNVGGVGAAILSKLV